MCNPLVWEGGYRCRIQERPPGCRSLLFCASKASDGPLWDKGSWMRWVFGVIQQGSPYVRRNVKCKLIDLGEGRAGPIKWLPQATEWWRWPFLFPLFHGNLTCTLPLYYSKGSLERLNGLDPLRPWDLRPLAISPSVAVHQSNSKMAPSNTHVCSQMGCAPPFAVK